MLNFKKSFVLNINIQNNSRFQFVQSSKNKFQQSINLYPSLSITKFAIASTRDE